MVAVPEPRLPVTDTVTAAPAAGLLVAMIAGISGNHPRNGATRLHNGIGNANKGNSRVARPMGATRTPCTEAMRTEAICSSEWRKLWEALW